MELVTGATGFIGRHLARRLLSEGRPVRALCRPGSLARLDPVIARGAEIARGDLLNQASLEAAARGATRVYHCAGQVSDWGAPAEFHNANVRATEWLLAGARRGGVRRFVHLSSIAVFGVPSPRRFDDHSPHGPGRDLYSRTKAEGERIALAANERGIFEVTVLRPAVVYGPWSTWVEEPLRMIRRKRMFLLGGGRGTCHPCYIENLLDAMLLAAEHPAAAGQAYIVGDDESIPFRDYFNRLAALTGQGPIRASIPLPLARVIATANEAVARARRSSKRPLLTHAAVDMVCTRSQMSIEKIKKELGYRPRFGVAAAMSQLQAHYRRG